MSFTSARGLVHRRGPATSKTPEPEPPSWKVVGVVVVAALLTTSTVVLVVHATRVPEVSGEA